MRKIFFTFYVFRRRGCIMMRAQCSICSDLFENCQYVNIAAVPCGHTFHQDCLMRWLESSPTCPSCRSDVKRNQIINRLFFDIQEDTCSKEEVVNKLHNQISNLKAQISEQDKQKHKLAESIDYYSTKYAIAKAYRDKYSVRPLEDQNVTKVIQRELKLMRVENTALVEEECQKTQRRLEELQSVRATEILLKGCDPEVQGVVSQYAEAGESSIKHPASLQNVVKREFNQVLADKKYKPKRSAGHHHGEVQHSKRKARKLRMDWEKTQEALSQIEKESNEN